MIIARWVKPCSEITDLVTHNIHNKTSTLTRNSYTHILAIPFIAKSQNTCLPRRIAASQATSCRRGGAAICWHEVTEPRSGPSRSCTRPPHRHSAWSALRINTSRQPPTATFPSGSD